MKVHNCINEHCESSVKVGYLESHKSFYKLSFEIYLKKNWNASLPYGELKIKRWVSKLLLSLSKGLNILKP
jgi:hypothetical protein